MPGLGPTSTALSLIAHLPAAPYCGLVGVDVLGVHATTVMHILEGTGHVATLATVVAQLPGAVDEVLLTQHCQLPRPIKDKSLQGPCGTECPA